MARVIRNVLAAACLLGGLAAASCSSTFTPKGQAAYTDCQGNPEGCPAQETCWPTSATALGCVPSKPTGSFGQSCEEQIGTATCADGLFCDATTQDGMGLCTYFCAGGRVCPAGYSCMGTTVGGDGGPQIQLCRAGGNPITTPDAGGPPVGDAGIDAEIGYTDAPAGDSSASMQWSDWNRLSGPESKQ